MSTVLSKITKKGFARFLVFYLCLGLATPATPLLAAPGDITDITGYIPFEQGFFAFEVEAPIDSLKGVPVWDELERVLDYPYDFALDNAAALIAAGYPNGPFPTSIDNLTGRPSVDNTTGAFLGAGTGNDQGWPSYRRTESRRRAVEYRNPADNIPCQPDPANPDNPACVEVLRSFVYRLNGDTSAAGVPCAPGSAGCVEVPLIRHLVQPLNYNYQGGEELRLLNIEYAGGDFEVPGPLDNVTATTGQTACGFNFDPATGLFTPDPTLRDVYMYTPVTVTVSPGIDRLEDDEASVDYNSPIQSDLVTYPPNGVCVKTVEPVFVPGPGPAGSIVVGEGICLCGGDRGEPGYAGFGVLEADITTQYSTPAVPGKSGPGTTFVGPNVPRTVNDADILVGGGSDTNRLFDAARGFIYARDPVTGFGVDNNGVVDPEPFDADGVYPNCEGSKTYPDCYATLRKASIRIPLEGCLADNTSHLRCGSGIAPNYLWNSQEALFERAFEEELEEIAADPANPTPEEIAEATEEAQEEFPAFVAPSNENDYIRNREAASILGKAIFWDMQLGSDSVQACGSCHFHAGADNRTKNQLNPNHLSGDFTFQTKGPNQEIEPADFPFHKLFDPEIAGDPACMLPVVTPLGQVVCDASNIESDSNDVMSSMGVFFGVFGDIPPVGSFTPADNTGVRSVPPDIRTNNALSFRQQLEAAVTLGRTDISALNVGNLDPIPGFQDVRRVEPRNTPTLFNSAMNFDNFWDGRARHDFNGGSVFGPTDPQSHVWVFDNNAGTLVPTKQIIRFVSLASLFTGPGLSNFEMSLSGRNWAKVAKKLLQPGATPLANQLVDVNDSVLGVYSNQGGVGCASLAVEDRAGSYGTGPVAGKPGLCISYPGLIRKSYYPALWENDGLQRIVGRTSGCTKPMLNGERDPVDPPDCDPFDGYVLALDNAVVSPTDTNQFTQMEANVPLFFALGVQAWGNILVPDDSPFDRFFDSNNESFRMFGESGEPFLVLDYANCQYTGAQNPVPVQACFTEVGNFKRDSNVARAAALLPPIEARVNCSNETCTNVDANSIPSGGTRALNAPDPLMGLDFFLGSNFSLKNPRFRSMRCGECHAGGTLTDHTFEISSQTTFGDWIPEFVTPGLELFPEPLTRGRVIHPFALEGELQENAQDGVERNIADFELDEMGFPRGMALFDNGMYNIGVRPIHEDQGRGGRDPFGFPLSLGYLAMMNLGGVIDNNGTWYSPGGDNPDDGFALPPYPGIPLPNFDPDPLAINEQTGLPGDPTGGGLFAPTGQDFAINPGFAEEPVDPQLPPYLAPWAQNINVGDESEIDEVFVGLNTLQREGMLEGWIDTWGPFNPAATIGEVINNARQFSMGLWPNVNRVNVQGAIKAPPLRFAELTGPYFHTGSKLTLRQELDFYDRGGDFPFTNSSHRDFLIMHADIEDEALGGYLDPVTGVIMPPGTVGAIPEFTEEQKEAIKVAMIDFLIELTDERVKFERAPFDHPEIFVPLDGRAPENTFGRAGFLTRTTGDCNGIAGAGPCFRQVAAVGAAGNATPLPNFLNTASGPRCTPKAGGIDTGVPANTFQQRVYAVIPECEPGILNHYMSDTTQVVVASARAVGSTSSGATVAATSGAAPQVLARSTGMTFAGPAVSAATAVTLDIAPSGLQTAGTTITFSAAASGGTGTYQYRFWVHDGTSWTIVQDFGSASSYAWTPRSAGTYVVQVHARSAGSTAQYEAWTGIEYTVR